MEKPLAGAILCCTSVAPELRSQYAEYALQMGAEHKLDLTSDVTHLLVGDSNTPKYKYVAREREDVRVLKPDWIEAVREKWMNDEKIDLNALEREYRYPTFSGLTICITGFDDFIFRTQLQEKITANGGNYTGDLSKTVTTLIAVDASSKKYEFATRWGIPVVGLKWFKDSLERGMHLEESSYALTVPVEEQGRSAWNRQAQNQQLGKRSRVEPTGPEPPRKLRRIASARLSSQNGDLWETIAGNDSSQTSEKSRQPLRPSKSLPTIGPTTDVHERDSFALDNEIQQPLAAINHGFLDDKYFFIYGFDSKREDKLHKALVGNGAMVLGSLEELDDPKLPADGSFLLVPHQCRGVDIVSIIHSHKFQAVTELWVEWCMTQKAFVNRKQYPLGKPIAIHPWHSFKDVIVNTTGLNPMMVLHVSKLVTVLGGKYTEVFKPGVTVLIASGPTASQEKLLHARVWAIPVVSIQWLIDCLDEDKFKEFEEYLLKEDGVPKLTGPKMRTTAQSSRSEELLRHDNLGKEHKLTSKGFAEESSDDRRSQSPTSKHRPGSDFPEQAEKDILVQREQGVYRRNTHDQAALPLKDISNKLSAKLMTISPKKQKLFKSLDGNASHPGSDQRQAENPQPSDSRPPGDLDPSTKETQIINGAIYELMNGSKSISSTNSEPQAKRRILERDPSNLSNSCRQSRASSIDTINTDGLGSEICADIIHPTKPTTTTTSKAGFTRGSSSLIGRGKPRDPPTRPSSIPPNDPGLCPDEYVDEEREALQLTQLGYEDPEEAIELRKKLAEKRRKKSREAQDGGQSLEGTANESEREREQGQDLEQAQIGKRMIVDDEALGDAGWGARGRMRRRESPKEKGVGAF